METTTSGQLMSAEDVRRFMLAGNATLTLVSKATGTRFTYKVTEVKRDDEPTGRISPVSHFVKLMNGPDNETAFTYLGHVYQGRHYQHGKKSPVADSAPSAKAFAWVWQQVVDGDTLPASLEVWHEGKCCRCGRKLTVPASIASGIGPECAGKMEG